MRCNQLKPLPLFKINQPVRQVGIQAKYDQDCPNFFSGRLSQSFQFMIWSVFFC